MAELPSSGDSVWYLGEDPLPKMGPLEADATADVCIVGAGIAGLTTAYLLAQEGKNVVVLESDEISAGETSRTTAHLASALDDGFAHLESLFGEGGARLAARSHAAAIDRIEQITREEQSPCDFVRLDGYLFESKEGSTVNLRDEFDAARRAGLDVTWLDSGPSPLAAGRPTLKYARQAQFHPLRYMAVLAKSFRKRGGRLFTRTPVKDFEDGKRVRVVTEAGPAVVADALVVATNTPVNDRFAIHTKQAAYRSYAVAFRIPPGSFPHALFWDTLDPYHYVRLQKDKEGEVLIVGGEDHKTGQAEDERECFARLEEWTRALIPPAGKVVTRWSGQVMEPVDSLAFIGLNPGSEHVYIATGDSGHGITHGTIAGILLTDLLTGRENAWAKLYDPSRKTLSAAGTFLSENLNVGAQYADWVTPGEAKDDSELAPGEGVVLRSGLTKRSVCRDEDGKTHRLSAVCPHLGCIVEWNQAEKSWDCPCHGSRFDMKGKVLNGPSLGDLAPAGQE
jgi:glycine/D-amino acid oxidase-like deaminating enzyme/nitrite reductase/ring-hydroxylating ferredoxin subunit